MAIKKEIIIEVNADQANKELEKVKTNVEENTEAVDGMTGSIDQMSGGAVSAFKGLVSGAKSGIAAMKTLRGAIMATGIGALVIVIISLISYFTKTEEGAQKLRIVFSAVGAVIDKLIDGLVAVGKFLTKIVSITHNVIAGNKTLAEGWNDAKEAGKEMGREIVDAYSNIGSSMQKAIDLQRRENELKIKQREGLVKEAELLVALSEARGKAADATLSNEERIKALNEAEKINAELFEEKIAKTKEALEIQRERNALAASDEEALMKEAELQAELIQLQADRNNANKELIAQRSGLIKSEQDRLKAEYDAQVEANARALEERNKKIDAEIEADIKAEEDRLTKIDEIQATFRQKNEEAAAQTEMDKIMLQQSRDMAALEALNATEEQKFQTQKYYLDLIAKEEKKQAEESKQLQMAKAMAVVNMAGQAANILSMMAKKDSKAYKALQIAQVAASGIQSVQNAFTTAPFTSWYCMASLPLYNGRVCRGF